MKLLILIPAFNEERSIAGVLQSISSQLPAGMTADCLVIDDGSTDATASIARQAGVRVIRNGSNRGLGATFQRGVEHALANQYDIMVNIDADGQFDGNDIPLLLSPLVHDMADVVTGSRFKDPRLIPQMSLLKKWGNRQIARLISWIAGERYYDVSCGFRAYSREALLQLNLFSRFTYTHETMLNFIFKGLRISEVPIRVRGERAFGESKISSNLFRYGYNMINTVFRTMLDFKPLRFFGWGGVMWFIIGAGFDAFILVRLILIGEVTPFKTLGFIGLGFNIFGLLLIIVGLVADMINRSRLTQERILYLEKRKFYSTHPESSTK